jgi:enamine deaminase RidA (YjgF/YER057c/UK114 family)
MKNAQQPISWTPGKARVDGSIRSGSLIFVGGIGGWYPDRRPEGPGDAVRQLSDALETMKASLQRAGASMGDVLQVQVALVDAEKNWPAVEEILRQAFPEPAPTISCSGSTGFRRDGQLLQVDCIASVA